MNNKNGTISIQTAKSRFMSLMNDVESLVRDITESSFIQEDFYGSKYCKYCGTDYGNVRKKYWDNGLVEPHSPNCELFRAREILQRLAEIDNENQIL